jgi:Photosystem II complex subunit Ycf12
MDALLNVFGSINWLTIFQLGLVAAIMIAGPIVIAVLAFRGGDL